MTKVFWILILAEELISFDFFFFIYKYKIIYMYILVNIMRKNSCNLYSVCTLEVGVNTVRQGFVLFNEIQTQMFKK